MERWMASRTARWVIVLGAGLLALRMGLTKYRLGAEETKEAPPKATAEAKPPKREVLRYAGKSFDQWRIEMETELKPETRVDGLTAMAAFGANGYGMEATCTIVGLMSGYQVNTENEKDKKVVEAAFEAIRKIDKPAFPVLWEGVRDDNDRIRRFANACFERYDTDWHPPVSELLKAGKAEDIDVRWTVLRLLRNVKDKPKNCLPLLFECLRDTYPIEIRVEAVQDLCMVGPEAKDALPMIRKMRDEPSIDGFFDRRGREVYPRNLINEAIKRIEGK